MFLVYCLIMISSFSEFDTSYRSCQFWMRNDLLTEFCLLSSHCIEKTFFFNWILNYKVILAWYTLLVLNLEFKLVRPYGVLT